MEEKPKTALYWTSLVLVLAGALNWLLVGLFGFNAVAAASAGVLLVERIVYILVGLAAIYLAWHVSVDVRAKSSPHGGPKVEA